MTSMLTFKLASIIPQSPDVGVVVSRGTVTNALNSFITVQLWLLKDVVNLQDLSHVRD